MGNDRQCHDLCKFLMDVIYFNNRTAHISPSVAAIVAVILARKYQLAKAFVRKDMDFEITGYKPSQVNAILKEVAEYLDKKFFKPQSAVKSTLPSKKKSPEVSSVISNLETIAPVVKEFLESSKMRRLTQSIQGTSNKK